jgi:hypothetical protein
VLKSAQKSIGSIMPSEQLASGIESRARYKLFNVVVVPVCTRDMKHCSASAAALLECGDSSPRPHASTRPLMAQPPLGQFLRTVPRFQREARETPGVLSFGKFKGQTFEDVYMTQGEYVLWIADHLGVKADKDLGPNQRAFLSFLRQRGQQELDQNTGNTSESPPAKDPQGDEAEGFEEEPVCPTCGAPFGKVK